MSFAQQYYSGVNNITFNHSQYNNAFAGNGFLIRYKDKVFAITVKHTLFVANTPKITSVYLGDEVKEWRIHPLKEPDNYVVLGDLINQNKNEALTENMLNSDWLVFEVKHNKSTLSILELRDTPLALGETLTAYGCTYATTETCRQDSYPGTYLGAEPNHFRMKMVNLSKTRPYGLSGSPVLDKNNKLVGIISKSLPSLDGTGFDSAPASLDYLLHVLNTYLALK